jgi:CDP-paratose 2-epimerase
MYGIPATSFRQSCIYGTRQFGIEDQGWIAWFTIAARHRRPITIYGDGKQVRDVLHVDDLVRAYEAAIMAPDKIMGQSFNIGGGSGKLLSLVDLIGLLEQRLGRKIPLRYDDWRPGDQRVYISDIRKLERVLGWKPEVGVAEGVAQLDNWVRMNDGAFGSPGEAGVPKPAVATAEPAQSVA